MRIREALAADAGAAATLWTESYSGAGPGEGRVEPYSEADFRETVAAATVLVAEADDGEVVGVAAVRMPGSPGVGGRRGRRGRARPPCGRPAGPRRGGRAGPG